VVSVDLYISEGLVIGYTLPANIDQIDCATIDISNIWEKHFLDKDCVDIKPFVEGLSKEQKKKLNLFSNSFTITLNGKVYFAIHDIGDGNYIALDTYGSIYKITHDPFGVNKINNNILDFLATLTFKI
jgi:hypothetical protein